MEQHQIGLNEYGDRYAWKQVKGKKIGMFQREIQENDKYNTGKVVYKAAKGWKNL